jgi:hypothetical protein
MGHPVVTLRYKPESRGFNSHGVNSAPNRNEYQGYLLVVKGGQCVGLITLPPARADCLEMLGASKT